MALAGEIVKGSGLAWSCYKWLAFIAGSIVNRMLASFFRLILVSLFTLLAACGDPLQVALQGQTMGTFYSIKYLPVGSATDAATVQVEIDRLLEEVNDQMSTYRPNSELSRFNASALVDEPFAVSPATAKVVAEALRIGRLTDGALDVTVGPLVNLWGFGPGVHRFQAPDEDELELRRTWTGIDKLRVEGNALVKSVPQLYVDLSAIAKGYGVDVVARYLESLNIQDYMVDIGGELRTRGHNERKAKWRIGIELPVYGSLDQVAQEVIQPGDMAMATSGDYRNYFEQDGVRYSHTIDPTTGHPVRHNLVSITVLARECMTADGMSTGLNVLGPEKGLALAESLNLPVFMIVKTDNGFEERYTRAFAPYLGK